MAKIITGKVSGFVLVVDPNNDRHEYERILFDDAKAFWEKVGAVEDECSSHASDGGDCFPTDMLYYTQFRRDDNGAVEEQEGVGVSGDTKIGDAYDKLS